MAQEHRSRLSALDSVRGIASFIVMLSHIALLYNWTAKIDYIALRLPIAGHGAVIVFFVLSGAVLSYSLERDECYYSYAIRRVARIYLPFLFALGAAAVMADMVGYAKMNNASFWFNHSGWHERPTLGLLLSHMLLANESQLDCVAWTLGHELRISLFLPFLVPLLIRRPMRVISATTALALAAAVVKCVWWRDDVVVNMATTLMFIPLFAIGGGIALGKIPLARYLGAIPRSQQRLWLIWSLILVTAAPYVNTNFNTLPLMGNEVLMLAVSSFGAAIIIAMAIANPPFAKPVLDHPFALYLGRISYSLYLIHMIVLEVLVRASEGVLPYWMAPVFTPIVAIPLADLMNRIVESGSQAFGRKMAAKRIMGGQLRTARTI